VVGYRSRRYPADTVISAGSKSSFIAMKRGDETPSPEFQLQVGHTLERFPSRYHIVANSRYDIFTGGGAPTATRRSGAGRAITGLDRARTRCLPRRAQPCAASDRKGCFDVMRMDPYHGM